MRATTGIKRSFEVVLPDGKIAKRTSSHSYTHVVAVKELSKPGWFAEWRTGLAAAQSRATYWKNCPATKLGTFFETRIIEVAAK